MKGEFGFCGEASSYENKLQHFADEIMAAYMASRQLNTADFEHSKANNTFFTEHSDSFYNKMMSMYG